MTEAFGLLDEAMLPVLAGQVPIDWAGDIYCVVLNHATGWPICPACGRGRSRWSGGATTSPRRPPTAGYATCTDSNCSPPPTTTAGCRTGWSAASRALEDVNSWAAGEGYYQLGEVRRLRGDADGAFAAFARARALGVDPQPGEALLRCRDGRQRYRVDRSAGRAGGGGPTGPHAAAAWRRRGGACRGTTWMKPKGIASELESGAEAFGTPGFRAWAAHARGACWCSRDGTANALDALQAALREYRIQQSRYETAQVYEWMAVAHKALGDDDAGRRRRRHRGEHLRPTRRRAGTGLRPERRPAA